MHATVSVKVVAARDLPVMDRSADSTDAFVELRMGSVVWKTEIAQKTLHPIWNTDWYKFELASDEMTRTALHIRVLDYDIYSANDPIGRTTISMYPFTSDQSLHGWFPLLDTLKGIRGEIFIVVKIEFIGALAPTSVTPAPSTLPPAAAGVAVYANEGIPQGFKVIGICGFLSDILVGDDPEYKWIDKIRTSRASNDARAALMTEMSQQLMWKLSESARSMQCNALIGYRKHIDVEGSLGLVVRVYGTAVVLQSDRAPKNFADVPGRVRPDCRASSETPDSTRVQLFVDTDLASSPSTRRNRTSPNLLQEGRPDAAEVAPLQLNGVTGEVFDLRVLEQTLRQLHPLITVCELPAAYIRATGGVVCARSVKVLGKSSKTTAADHQGMPLRTQHRSWWNELRDEVVAHMRSLCCNAVVGYIEQTFVYEDVVVLNAVGTAVLLNTELFNQFHCEGAAALSPKNRQTKETVDRVKFFTKENSSANESVRESGETRQSFLCDFTHAAYYERAGDLTLSAKFARCRSCDGDFVGEYYLSTLYNIEQELLRDDEIQPTIVQARVVRVKEDIKGEALARALNDVLPFMEHELHTDLIEQLRSMQCNSFCALRYDLSFGEEVIIYSVSGTAFVYASIPRNYHAVAEPMTLVDDQQATNTNDIQLDVLDYGVQSPSTPRPVGSIVAVCSRSLVKVPDPSLIVVHRPFVRIVGCRTATSGSSPNLRDSLSHAISAAVSHIIRTTAFSQRTLGNRSSAHFSKISPPPLCNLRIYTCLPDNDKVQIMMLGSVSDYVSNRRVCRRSPPRSVGSKHSMQDGEQLSTSFDERHYMEAEFSTPSRSTAKPISKLRRLRQLSVSAGRAVFDEEDESTGAADLPAELLSSDHRRLPCDVLITTSSSIDIAGCTIPLGVIDFILIRETSDLAQTGGICSFLHQVLSEVLFDAQAYTAACNGDAIVALRVTIPEFDYSVSRDHAQVLITLTGDIVGFE